jgi:hypothetical protein
MCKQFVRLGLDVPSQSPSAAVCFKNAKKKHKPKNVNDTPAYVPAFFNTGKHGHVVFTLGKDSKGRRLAISVDVQDKDNDRRREVGIVPLENFLKWGPWQGWTEDFDGKIVYSPSKKATPAKPVPAPTKPVRKTVDQIAQEVIDGKWGNGAARKEALQRAGYSYAAIQHKVNDLL